MFLTLQNVNINAIDNEMNYNMFFNPLQPNSVSQAPSYSVPILENVRVERANILNYKC